MTTPTIRRVFVYPHFSFRVTIVRGEQDFYRKSVFETKYLFTVNDMDLRLMVSCTGSHPRRAVSAIILGDGEKYCKCSYDVL